MATVETAYEHIVLEDGTPVIVGTTMKVSELILDSLAYGWSPEELKLQHPYLTLGQIHSALAYYWDHQETLERVIEEELERVNRFRQEMRPSPLIARLKARA